VWTWTAICSDTKLVPSWLVGERTAEDAETFMRDLASRLTNRVQLTTDGLRTYLNAVDTAFGADTGYAMLHKIYGAPDGAENERRYSPAVCTGIDIRPVTGSPNLSKARTRYRRRERPGLRPHWL
jgi:transposase-like protein